MEKCVKGIMVEQTITEKDNIKCFDTINAAYMMIYEKLISHIPSSLTDSGIMTVQEINDIVRKATEYVVSNMKRSSICNQSFLEEGIDFMYELIEADYRHEKPTRYFVEVNCDDRKLISDKISTITRDYSISEDPLALTIRSLCKDAYNNGHRTPTEMADQVYDEIYTYIHESEAIDYEVEDYFISNSI